MQKICCIGTSNAGKTLLSFQLATYYTQSGQNVKLIQDCSEKFPFPSKSGICGHSVMWIAHNQIQKELEAVALGSDIIICDTSPIDILMYARAISLVKGPSIQFLKLYCEHWMESYDKIYLVRNDLMFACESIREHEFQFDSWLERCNRSVECKVEIVKSSSVDDGSFLSRKIVTAEKLCTLGV
jgi:nicotinamide riboside kinase